MNKEEVLDEVNVIYERISNNENNLFSDGKYIEALEVLIDYYEVGFIEELEKLKAEIKKLAFLFDDLSPDKELVVDLDNIEEVIDKHISELKGENK